MASTTTSPAVNTGGAARVRRLSLGQLAVYVVMFSMTFLWVGPTIGLLVSSFRPGDDMKSSSCWTVATNPGAARFSVERLTQAYL